jgi:hypothetical protein
MPIKMSGRYPEGSDRDRAHKLLKEHDVDCDHVYGVNMLDTGQEEVTFTWNGKAQTAFCEHDRVVHVMEGWDVLPPKPAGGTWRGGY